jgi:hypothetical protein
VDDKIGVAHLERKRLFAKGVRRRFLTVEEIERSLPPGSLSALERWLFYYSLRAAEIEVRGEPTAAARPQVERSSRH